ncbi:MAG: hypothetical protein HUJ75_03995, partial [Parasporobacterium sp.]|nr:hypothetical protein [Parasporobacterium sp.]
MRKKKTSKKIRKIYKARLWPAIVFFVITALLSVLGACIFAISSMGDIVESTIETASVNTVYMANTITAAGADDEYVLNNLREFGLEVPDSFLIADSSGQVVAQTGDAPEDPVSLYMVNFQDSPYAIYEVYAERKDDHEYWVSDIFPRDQGLKALSFFNVSQAFLDNPAIGKQEYRHVAFDAVLWVRVPLSTGGYLQARWELSIYAVDLYQKFFDSIRFYGIFFLPILILLIYLIASIRNHRHATKILYTEPVTGGRNFLYYEYYGGKKLRKNTKNGPAYAVVDVSV